jgi:hypothetical protein
MDENSGRRTFDHPAWVSRKEPVRVTGIPTPANQLLKTNDTILIIIATKHQHKKITHEKIHDLQKKQLRRIKLL